MSYEAHLSAQSLSPKKDFWDIYVIAVGVKKKQRTKKNHNFALVDLEQSNDLPPRLEDYLEQVKQLLASEMRETSRAILCANPYQTELDPGFTVRIQRIFDPRNLRLEIPLSNQSSLVKAAK